MHHFGSIAIGSTLAFLLSSVAATPFHLGHISSDPHPTSEKPTPTDHGMHASGGPHHLHPTGRPELCISRPYWHVPNWVNSKIPLGDPHNHPSGIPYPTHHYPSGAPHPTGKPHHLPYCDELWHHTKPSGAHYPHPTGSPYPDYSPSDSPHLPAGRPRFQKR